MIGHLGAPYPTTPQYAPVQKMGGTTLSGPVALGGFGLILALALSVPIASAVVFGRRFGGPGYILGFFVPAAIGTVLSAIGRVGK